MTIANSDGNTYLAPPATFGSSHSSANINTYLGRLTLVCFICFYFYFLFLNFIFCFTVGIIVLTIKNGRKLFNTDFALILSEEI